jgi:hypothetical protein
VNKVKNYANTLSRGSLSLHFYIFILCSRHIFKCAHTVRRVTVKRSAGEKIESKFVSARAAFFCRDQKPSALIVYSAESSRAIIHGRALSPNAHSNVNEGPSFAKQLFHLIYS